MCFRDIYSANASFVDDICPCHRAEPDIPWRCSNVRCCVPLEIVAHKTVSVKGDRRVDSALSQYLLTATGNLSPVETRKYISLFILSD